MKKLSILALALVLTAGLLAGCTPAQTSSPETSGDSNSTPQESQQTTYTEAINTVKVYNVKDYGAKANGFDDSACIQAAIDACAKAGGGVVYLPAGTYSVADTIIKKAKVSIKGDGAWATYLQWIGGNNNAIIDTSNQALWGTTVSGIFFRTGNGAAKITGILGGSTLQNYNSAIGTFEDLVFAGLYCGISGNAEPSGVGIFDCYFKNVFMSDCTYGFHLYGSGNTIVHPRVATCEAGLVLDYLNGESFDGVHVIGGIFAANTTDILVPSKGGLRPCNFVGTWFEDAKQGIISITSPDTRVMNLTFRDCMLNSKADNQSYFMFDASNALGVVTLDSCTVVNNDGIIAPKNSSAVLSITNLQVYDKNGAYIINDSDHGLFKATADGSRTVFTVSHALIGTPSLVTVTPATSAAANGAYFVTADNEKITITFTQAPANGEAIEFYWEVKA